MPQPNGPDRISTSIRAAARSGHPALIPYLTAGFPTKEAFVPQLRAIAPHAAVIEVGVPFTDPMADGVTIQRSSRKALENGVTLTWILEQLATIAGEISTPRVLMGYLNPLLSMGLGGLASACAAAEVFALIIPDLPLEECLPLRGALNAQGVGLIQLVSPVTPPERAEMLARNSDGFLYAVTVTGVTGASTSKQSDPLAYLDRLRAISPVPVCAGFGIRSAEHVRALTGHADGAIVGSALIEAIEQGRDPAEFLQSLGRI